MAGIGSTMCSNSLNTSDFLNPLRLNNLDRCSEHEEFKTQRFNCQCPSSHSVNFHADSLVSAVKQNCPSCTEPGWGMEWQKSLSPWSPRQSSAVLLDPTGHETPESYLVDISRDRFGNRQLFSPWLSCTHTRKRDTPLLVSGIAGRCLGSKLTWLGVRSGTGQQEENEAERCRNFFSLNFI